MNYQKASMELRGFVDWSKSNPARERRKRKETKLNLIDPNMRELVNAIARLGEAMKKAQTPIIDCGGVIFKIHNEQA